MKDLIYVVEGKNDEAKIKKIIPDAFVITTNGSAVSKDIVLLLKEHQEEYDIVLILDPDYAGEKIRKKLENELDNPYHVFVDRSSAISKNEKKIGIEHVSDKILLEALKDLIRETRVSISDITPSFLYEQKLIGHLDSQARRDKLSSELKIGKVNGKTLYKRLRRFNIKQKQVLEVLS